MSTRWIETLAIAACVAGTLLAPLPRASAQGQAPAGRVPGTQLQRWLDEGFGYAGLHRSSQCIVLNVAQGSGRTLFIRCPNGWSEKIPGSARVVGETYCTSFPIPNTPPGEDCVTWHVLGQGWYEQRKGAEVDTTVVLIPPPPAPAR